MPTSTTWNGSSYSIPIAGELNWQTLSSFLLDLSNNAQTTNFQKIGARVSTSATTTISAATDCTVGINVSGAAAVNLPAGVNGQYFIIADTSGAANTNNITINRNGSDTINGATSLVLNANYQAVMLVYHSTGTSWTIAASYPSSLSLASFGSSPNASGASFSNNTLTLQPADGTHPGGVSTASQTFGGNKAFTGTLALGTTSIGSQFAEVAHQSAISTDDGFLQHTITGAANYGIGVDSGNLWTLGNYSALNAWASKGMQMSNSGYTSFPLTATFTTGISLLENIRASEGAGTTTLGNTDDHYQVFNLSAGRTLSLPTTGILAGEVFFIENQTTSLLTIQASGGQELTTANSCNANASIALGSVRLVALQATPTTAAQWYVSHVEERATQSLTFKQNVNNAVVTAQISRSGKQVVMHIPPFTFTADQSNSTITTVASSIPARFNPKSNFNNIVIVKDNGSFQGSPGACSISTGGGFTIFKDLPGNGFTNATVVGMGNGNDTVITYMSN